MRRPAVLRREADRKFNSSLRASLVRVTGLILGAQKDQGLRLWALPDNPATRIPSEAANLCTRFAPPRAYRKSDSGVGIALSNVRVKVRPMRTRAH